MSFLRKYYSIVVILVVVVSLLKYNIVIILTIINDLRIMIKTALQHLYTQLSEFNQKSNNKEYNYAILIIDKDYVLILTYYIATHYITKGKIESELFVILKYTIPKFVFFFEVLKTKISF